LNENIYGTFAEIGAGQETVRHFFRSGGSSGTIAKQCLPMTKILVMRYGIEQDGRYVTESRLKRMITMEGQLIEELSREKHPHKMFLVTPILSLQLISLNNSKATDG
jgi:hypothetical protein